MKKKILLASTIISCIASVCFLLLFLITPNNEKALRNQVRKQHKIFCNSILRDSNAFSKEQVPQHKFMYCEIVQDSIKGYRLILHYDGRSIRLREKVLAKNEKYYLLDDSSKVQDVQDIEMAISFFKTEKELVSALSPKRIAEINKIPKNDSISRMLSIITNLLIGNNNLSIAAYIENDSLKYLNTEDVCSCYVDLDSLEYWQKNDTHTLYTEQSLYEFLIGNRLMKPIPYQCVRMNFRDDKFFIGDSGVETFNADNADLQRMCMSNQFVVLHEMRPYLLEEQNQSLGNNIKWCQSDWIEQTKTRTLDFYKIPPVQTKKNYDSLRYIYLLLFISLMLICAIFLYFWWKAPHSGNEDDGTWEQRYHSLNKKYLAALAESKAQTEKLKSLGEAVDRLEKKKVQLAKDNSTNLQNTNETKKKYNELVQKYNELVGKYKTLATKNEALIAEAVMKIKLQYGQIEQHYREILPFYNSTSEIIKRLTPYLQGIVNEKDLRFWDRVLLQQLAIHELLIPLSKIWCKDINICPVAESALEKMRTDDLQQYMLLYLEKTLRYDNISSQEFSRALNEQIPQEIDNYNTKVKQLQIPDIAINQNSDKKYIECAELMRLKVAQLKLDESFKAKMWAAFGREFVDRVDETTDKTWFFRYVISLAYYTAEYLQFNANKSTDMSYYYNLTYLNNDFDSSYPKEYEHNYYGKSNKYADRIYDWCKELGIEHLQVLISEYLILP